MAELIEYTGINIFDVSMTKKNAILEFLGIKNYSEKKILDSFIIRVG